MPAKRETGVLTRERIISEGIITPDTFREEYVQAASYSLRLGDDYYIPQSRVPNDDINRNRRITENDISHCSDRNNVLIIPSYSSIVFSTEEKLNMPNNVVGRFDLRPKYAMQGLVLQVGTQVEPGYKGRLFGLILNFSSEDITIPKGEKLLVIEFSYTCVNTTLKTEDEKEYETLYKFIGLNTTPIKGALEEFQKQMKETNETIANRLKLLGEAETDRVRRRNSNISAYAAVGAAIIIPLVILFFTYQTYQVGDYPSDQIYRLKLTNDSLAIKNATLHEHILKLHNRLDSLEAVKNNTPEK